MVDTNNYKLLFEEFPELLSDGVILEKEVLAHFGLLFSGFALLEAAIQNFYIFYQQNNFLKSGGCKSEADWHSRYDYLERKAFAATMGNLINFVAECPEVGSVIDELRLLKKKRDYFAHHFFRGENSKFFNNERSLHLIYGMDKLRRRVKLAEDAVGALGIGILKEIHQSTDVDVLISEAVVKMKSDILQGGGARYGWE